MRGVVFSGDRKLDFIEFPDPIPGPGEVVLEMKASGICGSDLHIYRAAQGGPGLGLKGIETTGTNHAALWPPSARACPTRKRGSAIA
jgi:(R,R)-butanediol dehydrogenase / meso-butanediol dehydrogenase / diacetyl reductase